MIRQWNALVDQHREPLYLLFRHLRSLERPILLWSDIHQEYEAFAQTPAAAPLQGTGLRELLHRTQELLVDDVVLHMAIRFDVARWQYLELQAEEMLAREIPAADFLEARERLVLGPGVSDPFMLEVDFGPFERAFPRPRQPRSIGRGVEFLNRHLSGRLFSDPHGGMQRLVHFLSVHEVQGRPLLLNPSIDTPEELRSVLRQGLDHLQGRPPGEEGFPRELARLGFEPGWGRTAERMHETMTLLSELMEAPSADLLEQFLARIPMIFSLAIVSPHGYLAQSNVLGKPDTGGQVVYILDQVRALEQAMRSSIHEQGLNVEPRIVVLTRLIPEADGTTCDRPHEAILGTRNARILRTPFRDEKGEVVRHWISRFEIWPYLEQYALDAERDLRAELGGRPDLVIGNYSDGNLVASLLAPRLGVTQCAIAHALEKTKYLHSDLYWKTWEAEHHFSCQYTADLISMNAADFILTSTYQEIAGTEDSVGQYESYSTFTMPGLYRVVGGIDCFDPKFNIVSPGADPRLFFSYQDEVRRPDEVQDEVRRMVFGPPGPDARGELRDPDRPLLFAMSRLDRIKNVTGLLGWYAASPELRGRANLLLVGGAQDPARSADRDEREQIRRMHTLFDEHELDGEVRWLELQTDKNQVGELYRMVADTRGAFVQPALFEAFGLTVVEAMSSGLPTFATRYGGPREIIVDGVSGFHIDPTRGEESAARMVDFLVRAREEPEVWDSVSREAIRRVASRYNWPLYAARFLTLSRIYGFWRFVTHLDREQTRKYLDMFYALMYRPRAATVGGG